MAAKPKSIGARIRSARTKLRLSCAELARRCGVNAATICYWETNRHTPKAENIEKLAAVLATSVQALLGMEPPEQKLETLGQRIRAARTAANLSQLALGTRIGITQERLSCWELDKHLPCWQHILALALALDIEPQSLQEAPPPPPEPTAPENRCENRGERIAAEFRRRAKVYAETNDPEMAVNAEVLADLTAAHWPRGYPNLDIPHGEGAPLNVHAMPNVSVTGSSAASCAETGGM